MAHLVGPLTWLIIGMEMLNSEQPENDAEQRQELATTFIRTAARSAAVIFGATPTLDLLDARIDRGEVQWIYVGEGKQRFRFAALSLPAFSNDRGQELAAVAVVSTRKYKTGREGATRALCHAIAETLGPADQQRI
jgi:hypothetical protein